MSSALWCVVNGRAAAPPAIEAILSRMSEHAAT
jgi:hypothetical protein